ncbi:ABC-type multidrug/protein/lipid transport system ATPase component [Metamycoplasma cloacale]|uniref:ABC transporter ATP-binding protein n=1 Tax=Metamycoplasma cloacale TaxID=92401 RepID=A0A2Z4LLU1_9BACT|nr:ABC transporter ATP-binding protein [Metamycoplasma cloacale]AWX42660.1 ABC transporter ATP-binding protein [Metamycoplasma cloacale]VEU79535.1 ABC-type multidrug/protein/lipid transport system ATPase component [Metamycoplasma cloacale]
MHNLDPFKTDVKLKHMDKKERKMIKKQFAQIKRESLKKMIGYINYRKHVFAWIILLNLLSALLLATSTFALGYITDNFLTLDYLNQPGTIFAKLGLPLGLLALSYVVQQAINLLSNNLSVKAGVIGAQMMRSDAYKSIMRMPISYFEASNNGELMSILSNDIDNVLNGLAGCLSPIFTTAFIMVSSLAFMLYYSIYLSLITLLFLPIFYSIIGLLMMKAVPQFQKQQQRIAKLNGYIEEHLSALHLIKAYNQFDNVNNEFNFKNNKLYKSSFKASLYSGIIYPYANAVTMILQLIVGSIGAVFATTGVATGSGSNFTFGIIVSFLTYIRIMTNQIIRFFENIAQMQMASVSASRVLKIIDLKPLVDETQLGLIDNVKGDVEFRNIDFSYVPNAPKLQLQNASFKATRGQVFAIVGPTGAGKTTIINLLTKFYLPNSGDILIDDHKSTEINEHSWRNQISIVLQDTFLFKTTIMENLRYANFNATDEEIYAAAKLSKADDFIKVLANGYNEIVEEGGANFSQGERQLLAITRAIIANKNILILDEATSNVDTRTEKNIQEAMLNLMKGKTSFVIAHRLSTIVNADKILVINDGKIIEQGSHAELLALKGFYEKLYHSSFSED